MENGDALSLSITHLEMLSFNLSAHYSPASPENPMDFSEENKSSFSSVRDLYSLPVLSSKTLLNHRKEAFFSKSRSSAVIG